MLNDRPPTLNPQYSTYDRGILTFKGETPSYDRPLF